MYSVPLATIVDPLFKDIISPVDTRLVSAIVGKLSKTEVVVKGSRKALDKIATVKALIDLDNDKLTDAGTYNVDNIPLVAYDSKGIILKDIEIVPGSLTATIKLNTHKATVPLSVMTTGELVTGKAIASILINNNSTYSLDIYGEQEEINSIASVPVTINVEGEGNNGIKTYNVTISKPNGVRSMSPSSATISVTFGDEKQKTIDKLLKEIKSKKYDEVYLATDSLEKAKKIFSAYSKLRINMHFVFIVLS